MCSFYISISNIPIINPLNEPIEYISARMNKFSFTFLFPLNNTSNATPLPVSKPAITLDKEIKTGEYGNFDI